MFGAGVDKKTRLKLYAVLFRVSRVWSPASASVTGAREAPAVFFQGKKIKIASNSGLKIHSRYTLILSAPCFFFRSTGIVLENRKFLNCLVACVRTSSCSSPLCAVLIYPCLLCSTGTSVPNCFQCCTSSSDPVQSCPADSDIRWVLSFCSKYFYISILPITSSGTVQNGLLTP